MKKKGVLLWLLTAVLVATLGGAAHAQFPTPEDLNYNYAINAGVLFPINNNVNMDNSFIVGVSWYGAADNDFGNNAALGLSGDWTVIERNDGENVNLVPLMLNYRQYGIIGGYRVFVNLGIGVIAATDDIPEMKIDDGTNFGWTGGLGVDLNNQVFAQFRFIGGRDPGEDGLATVELGYRF